MAKKRLFHKCLQSPLLGITHIAVSFTGGRFRLKGNNMGAMFSDIKWLLFSGGDSRINCMLQSCMWYMFIIVVVTVMFKPRSQREPQIYATFISTIKYEMQMLSIDVAIGSFVNYWLKNFGDVTQQIISSILNKLNPLPGEGLSFSQKVTLNNVCLVDKCHLNLTENTLISHRQWVVAEYEIEYLFKCQFCRRCECCIEVPRWIE